MTQLNSPPVQNKTGFKSLVTLTAIIFLFAFIYIALSALLLKTSPLQLVNDFLSSINFPYTRSGHVGTFKSVYIAIHLYNFVFCSILFLIFVKFLCRQFKISIDIPHPRIIIPSAGFIVFFFITALYLSYHVGKFSADRKRFENFSPDQYYETFHQMTYPFALLCKENVSGHNKGEFLTDINIHSDWGGFLHRQLSYHLYPAIDIRSRHSEPADYLVIFEKKNAQKAVPADFKVLKSYDEKNLLAVRKK